MRAIGRPHGTMGWEPSRMALAAAVRAQPLPSVIAAAVIVGLSALLWDVVLGVAHWLGTIAV